MRLIAWCAALVAAIASVETQAQNSYCATYTLASEIETKAFYAPMTYRVLDTPQGRVLLAEGEVTQNEAAKLEQALARSGPVDEIWFNSPGGMAIEGTKMGRKIRLLGLATRLRTGTACISACSYAFLGGMVRIVEPGSFYGIHMFSSAESSAANIRQINAKAQQLISQGKNRNEIDAAVSEVVAGVVREIEQSAAQTAAIRARYLIDMSLSLDFMTDAFGTQADKVCYLSTTGIGHYNVANAH